MLLLCRAKLPCVAALEHGLNSALQAGTQLQTNNRLAGSTWWQLRNSSSYTVGCSPALSGSRGGCWGPSVLSSETRRGTMFPANALSSVRYVIAHRQRLNLYNNSDHIRVFWRNLTYRDVGLTRNRTHGDALKMLLFTSGAEVCNHHVFRASSLQTRTLSSVADAPKRVEDSAGDQIRKGVSTKGPVEPKLPESEENKPSKTQQLKKVFKEYGAVGVSFHICISLMSLGMFYLAVSSGIDMAAILYKIGFSQNLVESKLAAGTSTFVLAYAVHKLFAPVRMSITLVSVPLLVRYLRKTGLFKPPTSPSP
ncbi:hypothetical protein DPEC_G00209460 [Dallia pectoralis]|uniref:Uncharacterized protein n=1 Tax=Dallia pectoralis TaxID=75939 RepID=A0ACC2G5M0_DALPE|nr:hypothetical protein DPEC_G00209460 [Dallia pectoralis]